MADAEKDQLFRDLTERVGPPTGSWNGDQWSDSRNETFTFERIRDVFTGECILFIGDSLQRRAADTLHQVLLQGTLEMEEPGNLFAGKACDRGFRQLDLEGGGCIDIDWRPMLQDIEQFALDTYNASISERYRSNYTLIVAGSNIWDTVASRTIRTSVNDMRESTDRAIRALTKARPDPLIVWKTGGWTQERCPLIHDENQKTRCTSDKILAGNAQARETIASLNNTTQQVVVLDWAREILPRSLGSHRLSSNDRNPHHYGLAARIQFLQQLAGLLEEQQELQEPPKEDPKPVVTSGLDLPTLQGAQFLNLVFVSLLLLWSYARLRRKRITHDY